MNTELRKKNAKTDFENDFFKLMNDSDFAKTMEKVRKHRDVKLATIKKEETIWYQNQIIIPQSFPPKICWLEKLKKQIFINKPAYLGLSILEISKMVMYEFWYDYVNPKYGKKVKLCYMDTDRFIMYIKTDNIYKNIVEDAEARFDTSKYQLNRPLPKGKNEKVIGVMNGELDGKIMQEFVGLRVKPCS